MILPRPVLVIDGDCAFCSSAARVVTNRLRAGPTDFSVEPWQRLDLGPLGLTEEQCSAALQWVATDGRVSGAQDAVARCLLACRWWARPVGALLLAPGMNTLAGAGYRWVARNRSRLPGGTPACAT